MADVNPNQDFRFKEIMKRIIPASYFMILLFTIKKIVNCEFYDFVPNFKIVIQALSSNILYGLLSLVIVYVIGFIINNLASKFERTLYKFCLISRSSRLALTKKKRLKVEDVHKIVNDSKIKVPTIEDICQKQAEQIFNYAKDHITRRDNIVEDYYYQSIIARNLLTAHFFSLLSSLLLNGFLNQIQSEWFFMIGLLLVGLILWKEWRRKSCLYAHNVFVEYLKENH